MKSKMLIRLGTLTLALAVFLTACSTSPDNSFESFSLLMDKVAGPGNWSAQSNEAKGGTLVVKGFSIKPPAEVLADLPEGKTFPPLTVETVEIKKMVDKATLEKLLATADWKNAKETKLADSLVLTAMTIPSPPVFDFEYELKIGETSMKDILLSAAGAEAPAGPAGFLKALVIDGLSFKDYNFKVISEDIQIDGKVNQTAMEGINFKGTPIAGLESIDQTGLITAATGLTAKKSSLSGFSVNFKSEKGQGMAAASIGSGEYKDIKGLFSVGEYLLNDMKIEIVSTEKPMDNEALTPKVTMGLAKAVVKGMDSTEYMQKYIPVMVAAASDPERANEVLSQIQTIGDFLVSPVSVEEMSFSGLDFNVFDLLTLKMDEASFSGPYVAGQIPAKQKSSFKGLELQFTDDVKKYDEDSMAIYDALKAFGMNTFKMSGQSEASYNAQTGLFRTDTERLTIEDLMELSGHLEISGLTGERVETLKNTPISMIYMAMLAPDQILGDVGLNSMKLKIEDNSLIDRTFKAVAAGMTKNGHNTSPEQLRLQAVAGVQLMLSLRGSEFIEKPEELAKALGGFLEKPEALEIDLNADPTFSMKSVMSMAGNYNRILNSLNLSVTANGQKVPLKFAIAGFPEVDAE